VTYRLGRLLVPRRPQEDLAERASPEHVTPGEAVATLARAVRSGTRADQRRLARLAPALPADLAALARQLARRPGDVLSAVRAIPKRTRRFHLSAFQSRVFNRVLAARLARGLGIDTCLPGDVAIAHGDGRVHALPTDRPVPEELLARCVELAVSPSGPMPGTSIPRARGLPGELEDEALAAEDVRLEDFADLPEGFSRSGARRPLRTPVTELETRWREDGVELRFRLERGAFATTVLEELRKDHAG